MFHVPFPPSGSLLVTHYSGQYGDEQMMVGHDDCQEENHSEGLERDLVMQDCFVQVFPGASKNYKGRKTFMDNFDDDSHAAKCQDNLYYPFALLRKHLEILPSGPQWKFMVIEVDFPIKQPPLLYFCNVIECLQALLSDPTLIGHIKFCPCKIFDSAEKIHQVYHDWLTGDHAWELQIILKERQNLLPPGAMLLGVILLSDKMHMTTFDRLLHHVIDIVIVPLKKAAEYGCMMNNPFRNSKYCFTLLAAYVADTPEACVLSCMCSSTSHVTMAKSNDLPEYFKACKGDHLNGVNAPFWQNWPLTEPYIVFGPEALHHFHKMFWDHDLQWAINLVGTTQLDFRFTLLQPLTSYCQFKEGVSALRSPSGQDHCNIQCYIIGVIAGAVLQECLIAMHALNEFWYHAQASHFEEGDVTRLQSILKEFHDKKASTINTEA
ncbi:hypothetical protein EDC04DRAFT_2601376 [Pisolithus marmoratus]|nr:hypothetical protein EDC04DRAFT_2601376 [Pisolithus marmoratus]